MAPDAEAPTSLARRFASSSPRATEELAAALASLLPDGTVLALVGELGSGKTCFVRGLARGLGSADQVSSPTYTLMHEYAGPRPLVHFDAWMQGRESAFLEGGGAEWLEGPGLAAVEWADRVARFLPPEHLEVELRHGTRSTTGDTREIRITVRLGDPADPHGRSLARALGRLAPPNGIEERGRGE